jgi:hypothetical protein
MKPSTYLFPCSGLAVVAAIVAMMHGCSASNNQTELPAGAAGGVGGSGGVLFGGGGVGGDILPGGNGGGAAAGGADPCVTGCGGEELCDAQHAGLDDNCDGAVDEGCLCTTGMVQSCFKGNPTYRDMPGCFPGTQHCTEFGTWGECIGGVHATDDCFQEVLGCHAITAYPFQTVNLKDGTGDFSNGATSESWVVDCPPGVSPCPGVSGSNPIDDFQPLQSGEYTVHYTRDPPNGDTSTCDYPLFVGAPGLRVELEWEHDLGGTGVDLDLHMHKPQDTTPWGGNSGTLVDCAWDNCVFHDFVPQGVDAPNWFSSGQPPQPVNWYLDPLTEKNTCYFAPRGVGAQWQTNGQGCHNPRLDLDNITCDPTVLDVNSSSFCAPENINIDYPPANQWIRIGVHYYSSHGLAYDVRPRIRIFCDAAQIAELGPQGYNTPVTFAPADTSTRFWLVADVRFLGDPCISQKCEVRPLYYDEAAQTALLATVAQVQASYGPPYPPL